MKTITSGKWFLGKFGSPNKGDFWKFRVKYTRRENFKTDINYYRIIFVKRNRFRGMKRVNNYSGFVELFLWNIMYSVMLTKYISLYVWCVSVEK